MPKNQFSVIRLSEKAGVRRFEVAQKQQERRRDGLRRQFPTGFVFMLHCAAVLQTTGYCYEVTAVALRA
ncbi:hypothetical protein [Neisseria bacilliformis]|uniref:hypothetical protein n=1 Tax=Neisseria bacilliformis TaxID=267212 RepID=UPI00128CEE37|nr:hypothetical protein [Neisseria bacilliformis]